MAPFFYHKGKIAVHKIPVNQAEERAGKFDNPFSHEELFQRINKSGDYIDVPRGRVIWDAEKNRSIIYVDVCIQKKSGAIEKIAVEFGLSEYVIESDLHYRCKRCVNL